MIKFFCIYFVFQAVSMARKRCYFMVKSLRSAFSKRPAAAERLFSYAQILLGALIGGAAYPLFMTPNSIAPGGITGIR